MRSTKKTANVYKKLKTVLAVTSMLFLMSIKSSGQQTLFFGPVVNPSITFSSTDKPKLSSDLQLSAGLLKTRAAYQLIWSPAEEVTILFGEYFVNKNGSSGKNPLGLGGLIVFDYAMRPSYGLLVDIGINGSKQWLTPVINITRKTSITLNLVVPFQWSWEIGKKTKE